MPILLIILIGLFVVATAVAVFAFVSMRERRLLIDRVDALGVASMPVSILQSDDEDLKTRIGHWLKERAPATWSDAGDAQDTLVHAGYDGALAPIYYATIRLGALVFLPLIALMLAPKDSLLLLVGSVGIAFALGLIGPRAVLDRLATRRKDRVRKSLPDCLDLMVVCVEAGISLDAAMLRVARDMHYSHPDLAYELLVVNRKMNAGLTRDESVHGLWRRTGVEELRALTSSIIQSERLGTSITRVLRVFSETSRRKRKQAAEKKASEAALKMIVPLGIFMLPALFAIILGPAAMQAGQLLKSLSQ